MLERRAMRRTVIIFTVITVIIALTTFMIYVYGSVRATVNCVPGDTSENSERRGF